MSGKWRPFCLDLSVLMENPDQLATYWCHVAADILDAVRLTNLQQQRKEWSPRF